MEISSEEIQRKETGWRFHILMVAVTGTIGHGKRDAFARFLGQSTGNLGHILHGSGISNRILRKCKNLPECEGLTIDWLLTGDITHLSPSMLRKLWRAEISLIIKGKKPPESLGALSIDYHKRPTSVPQLEYDNLSQDKL
jgi:hypothetical protein